MFLVILSVIWKNKKINVIFFFEFVELKIDLLLCSKLF